MRTITGLPDRPLRNGDVASLNDVAEAVPYGGVPVGDKVQIYAVKVATGKQAHALGFDDGLESWQQVASVDASNLEAADKYLDAALDEWVDDTYGERVEVLEASQTG